MSRSHSLELKTILKLNEYTCKPIVDRNMQKYEKREQLKHKYISNRNKQKNTKLAEFHPQFYQWIAQNAKYHPQKSQKRLFDHYLSIYNQYYQLEDCLRSMKSLRRIKNRIQIKGSKQKCLFLNLKNTLVHLPISYNLQNISFEIIFRPFLFNFLDTLKQYYDLYAFTADSILETNAIIKLINKRCQYINGAFSKQDCVEINQNIYVKDLKSFQEKDLKDMVIIDHDFYCYGSQINNRIPVSKFEANCEDEELNNIKDLLVEISKVFDVRQKIKQQINIPKLLKMKKQDLNTFFCLRGV